jgi:hypothetical protein
MLTTPLKSMAREVFEEIKVSSDIPHTQAINEFADHCKQVAGEQESSYDADRIRAIHKSIARRMHLTTINSFVLLCLVVGGFLWNMGREVERMDTVAIQRDITMMRKLWLYQFSVDSTILWHVEQSPNFTPLDTSAIRARNRIINWPDETIREALSR